jgi:hypothetical protein
LGFSRKRTCHITVRLTENPKLKAAQAPPAKADESAAAASKPKAATRRKKKEAVA